MVNAPSERSASVSARRASGSGSAIRRRTRSTDVARSSSSSSTSDSGGGATESGEYAASEWLIAASVHPVAVWVKRQGAYSTPVLDAQRHNSHHRVIPP